LPIRANFQAQCSKAHVACTPQGAFGTPERLSFNTWPLPAAADLGTLLLRSAFNAATNSTGSRAHFLGSTPAPGPDFFFLILRYAIAAPETRPGNTGVYRHYPGQRPVYPCWPGTRLMALKNRSALMLLCATGGCAFSLYNGLAIPHSPCWTRRPLAVAQPQNNAPASYLGSAAGRPRVGVIESPKNAPFLRPVCFACFNSQSTPWAITRSVRSCG